MNTDKRNFRLLKKGDVLLIASLVAIILAWFLLPLSGSSDNLKMVIYENGEAAVTVELSSLKEGRRFLVNGCEIYADSKGVRFVDSCCEDGLCVKRGTMTRAGDTMACVPERVVVSLYGGSDTHIEVY